MKRFCNGHVYEFPDQNGKVPASALWQTVKADPAREQLVLHRPDGKNEVIPTTGNVAIKPEDMLSTFMIRERGHE